MNDKLVSIIVPVYNAEKYLHRCIQSMLDQTYSLLEIILIDDGSTDKSLEILYKYAKKDSRIKVIHQENGGISMARNAGLRASTGEYITFLDNDDWLPLNAIEYLYKRMMETNAELVIGRFCRVLASGAKLDSRKGTNLILRDDKNKLADLLHTTEAPWCKLYRASILKTNDIEFPIVYKGNELINEDMIFLFRYMQCCSTIATTGKIVYYWSHIHCGSESMRFRPNFNICFSDVLKERLKLFSGTPLPEKEEAVIVELFIVCLTEYAKNLTEKEAILKIKETHERFEELFNTYGTSVLRSNNYFETYDVISKWLDLRDYTQIYHYFTNREFPKETKRKKHMKKYKQLILPFERFLVYRCNLLFKK